MNGNVEALRRLFVEIGGDPSEANDCLTTVAVLNAIARQLGGEGGAIINPAAIDNIADVAGSIVGHTTELMDMIQGTLTSIEIPKGTQKIKHGAFDACLELKSVVIPDGVTSIGNTAFRSCIVLESIVIPDSVTSVGTAVLQGCYALKSAVLSSGMTSVGQGMFNRCTALESVEIPEGIARIETNAFSNCTALKSVILPSTITEISIIAFVKVTGTIYCRFSEGAVSGAPWGATGTIVYDYNG